MDKPLPIAFDPTHDIYHYERHPLESFFTPKNVDRLAARLRAFLQGGTRAGAAALSPGSRALLLVHRMTWFFEAYVRAARFGRSAS